MKTNTQLVRDDQSMRIDSTHSKRYCASGDRAAPMPSTSGELSPADAMEQAAMTATFYLRMALVECAALGITAGPERGLIVAGYMQAAAVDYAAWSADVRSRA